MFSWNNSCNDVQGRRQMLGCLGDVILKKLQENVMYSVGFRRFIRHRGLMNYYKQRTRWILPSALLPSAFLHTIHVNPQPEVATYWVLMRATHPPSVNLGDPELCGPPSGSHQHSRALCAQHITGVLSSRAPSFWSGNEPAHHMLGKLTATVGTKLCDAVGALCPASGLSFLSPFSDFCLGLGFVCFRQKSQVSLGWPQTP